MKLLFLTVHHCDYFSFLVYTSPSLNRSVRRNVDNLRKSLESVVVPIFSTSSLSADEDKIGKLNKLLNLWEKNKYFGPDTLEVSVVN